MSGFLELIAFANFKAVSRTATIDATAPGLLGVYVGVQIEDASNGHAALVWDSLDALKASRNNGSLEQFKKSFGDFSGEPTIVQVSPASNIDVVLGAPVSEFAFALLKKEEDRGKWSQVLKTTLGGIDITPGAIAGVHGVEHDKPLQYVFVIGWESIEQHREALSAAYASDIYNDTITLTEFQARHARLRKLI